MPMYSVYCREDDHEGGEEGRKGERGEQDARGVSLSTNLHQLNVGRKYGRAKFSWGLAGSQAARPRKRAAAERLPKFRAQIIALLCYEVVLVDGGRSVWDKPRTRSLNHKQWKGVIWKKWFCLLKDYSGPNLYFHKDRRKGQIIWNRITSKLICDTA